VPGILCIVAGATKNGIVVRDSCLRFRYWVQKLNEGLPGVSGGQGNGNKAEKIIRGHVPPPPQICSKCPFFVMKSSLFVQANVAVNIILTSKVPCCIEYTNSSRRRIYPIQHGLNDL
jgi:hypothetical protein